MHIALDRITSIVNAGYAIKSYVHYSTNYFNAFWDGSRMTYGDGNSKPLTSIDVCGHEITHGLTSHTAALNYSYESGALNEGFSDLFGTTIEFYAKPTTANWLIGEAFSTLRSMSNPKQYGQPNTYKGVNWATGTADNGGVHTNSGVLNYWYYLVSQGGSGVNDNGTSYTVAGIGIAKAAAIAYRTLTVYLVSSSQYLDARTYSIQAATDLYGATSNEVIQVTAAWMAVGVGAYVPPPCTDNYEANETLAAAKTIATNTDITGKISTGTDKDWFKIVTVSTAPKLKVTLANLPANYDLILYKSNGSSLSTSKKTGTTAESITYNATSAATYYIQVYGYNSTQYNANSCYMLRVATSNVNLLSDQGINGTDNDGDPEDDDDQITGPHGAGNTQAITLFPNPAKDNLTISLFSVVQVSQEVYITDLTGRILMTKSVDLTEGQNDITVDLTFCQIN